MYTHAFTIPTTELYSRALYSVRCTCRYVEIWEPVPYEMKSTAYIFVWVLSFLQSLHTVNNNNKEINKCVFLCVQEITILRQ